MTIEYCPKCHKVQNMLASTVDTIEKDENGEDVRVTTVSFQCSICNSFIRSDNTKHKIIKSTK